MRQQRDELLEMPTFTVWGISSPGLFPCVVQSSERDGSGWQAMTLGYGDLEVGPSVSVRTGRDHGRRQIAELRRSLPAANCRLDTSIVVSGERRQIEAYAAADRWAASLTVDDLRLTVRGIAVHPDMVWLVPVDDLSLYRRAAAPPWLAGLDAQRLVLDQVLAHPDHVNTLRRRHFRRWQRAIRGQQALAGGDRDAATATLSDLIDHIAALTALPWFAEPDLRRAAIEETLRHHCLGDEVASAVAQQAWQGGPDSREAWLLAWSAWSVSPQRDAD